MIRVLQKHRKPSFVIALTVAVLGSYTSMLSADTDPIAWVHSEKIRMGWSPATLDQFRKMAEAGMNAVMPRHELDVVVKYDPAAAFKPVSENDANIMKAIYDGSRLSKELGLRYFHCLNLAAESQTHEVGFQDNAARFNDGKLPSPVDPVYWQRTIVDRISRLLELLEDRDTYALDAIIIDPEMYALGDALPGDPDYGTFAFDTFMNETNRKFPAQKLTTPDERRQWLEQERLQAEYETWQYNRIRDMARSLREMVHQRRPELILGYIIYEDKMWFHAMAEGLSTAEMPVFIGPESTYSGVMDDRMIAFLNEIREQVKVPTLLVPGVIMMMENGRVPHKLLEVLPGNIYQRCQHSEGYWVYAVYHFGDTEDQQSAFFNALKTVDDALDKQKETGKIVDLPAASLPISMPANFNQQLHDAQSLKAMANDVPRADLATTPALLRGSYTLMLWPQEGQRAVINLRAIQLGVYLDQCEASIFNHRSDLIWKDVVAFNRLTGMKVPENDSPVVGAIVGAGMNAFAIEDTTCPMMILPENMLALNAAGGLAGRFYFYVPENKQSFQIALQGHPGETVDYSLYDASGVKVFEKIKATQDENHVVPITNPGVWCVEVDNVVDDAWIKLIDLPNRFALRPEHVRTDLPTK